MTATLAPPRSVARDISYATSARSRAGRAVIRLIEAAGGRDALVRRVEGYEREVAQGRSFWEVIPERFGLTLEITHGSLAAIPASGPLVVIANHPYGILDGLMMGHLLDRARGSFRILANSVFRRAEALDRVILRISFDETREAVQQNLETRRAALEFLAQGGAVGVFPGGTVSTGARMFSRPLDPGWRSFTAKMVARSGATVVPVFFEGQNSRLFQIASHIHASLRLGLLVREFRSRVDAPVRVAVGAPLTAAALAALNHDPAAMMARLRAATYALSPRPQDAGALGYEFDPRHRRRANPLSSPSD